MPYALANNQQSYYADNGNEQEGIRIGKRSKNLCPVIHFCTPLIANSEAIVAMKSLSI